MEFSYNLESLVYFFFDHSLPNVAPHHLSTSFGCAINHEVRTLFVLSPEILANLFRHLLEACNHNLRYHAAALAVSLSTAALTAPAGSDFKKPAVC